MVDRTNAVDWDASSCVPWPGEAREHGLSAIGRLLGGLSTATMPPKSSDGGRFPPARIKRIMQVRAFSELPCAYIRPNSSMPILLRSQQVDPDVGQIAKDTPVVSTPLQLYLSESTILF